MARVQVTVDQRDQFIPGMIDGTEASVDAGAVTIRGDAYALRLLSTALLEAADLADAANRVPPWDREEEQAKLSDMEADLYLEPPEPRENIHDEASPRQGDE